MSLSRRDLLQIAATVGVTAPLFGCEHAITAVTEQMGQTIPETLSATQSKNIDPAFHLLSRAAFGPWPGDLERMRDTGMESWIQEQLHPDQIDDRVCDLRARRFEETELDPGNCYEFKKDVLREDLSGYELLRAIYSKRQLNEVMVEFWSDHLNINIDKGDCIYLKPSDQKLVIRQHALGMFSDLIKASAVSPAMLVYLDGKDNKKDGPRGIPNENYGRELLELHTLGVHGGYRQRDVYEVARCLTGWRLDNGWKRGTVYFDSNLHDNGEKTVLGHHIAAGGNEKDLDAVIDIVCHHPSTAKHIATKLCARLVSETPPSSLVAVVESVFKTTGGNIRAMVDTILRSQQFYEARGEKLKRPFRYIVTCLRSLGADTFAHASLTEYLTRMGQPTFQHPTPDGYAEKSSAWVGTLLWRWNFAFALASGAIPSVEVNLPKLKEALGQNVDAKTLFCYLVGRAPHASELKPLAQYVTQFGLAESSRQAELLGLILASPAYQRY